MIEAKADILFEASWEVCNKVGGIYTVVKSKANLMKSLYKEYFLIGPYFEDKAKVDFEPQKPPNDIKEVFDKLKNEGIICHYGTWNITGDPFTILIDFQGAIGRKDEIKTKLWECHKIDSIYAQWDFEEPLIWAWAASRLIEEIKKKRPKKKIVAHFHEWLAGSALLHLKMNKAKVGTIFTTHATMLGRAIAGSDQDLYGMLNNMNPEEQAYNYHVQEKFQTERACAHVADIFTTVSEITGIEAEKILGKKPHILVPNGLDIEKFPTIEEIAIKHVTCRDKIREFLTYYFFPHYSFDINHTMVMFIVGRYEFRNKGLDIFIKALAKLNERLKKEKSKRTIAAIFWIPNEIHGTKIELLENKNFYRHIKNYVQSHSDDILSRILYDIVSQKDISKDKLFTREFMLDIKKDILSFKRTSNPNLVTHNLNDEGNDITIRTLRENGLDNKESDKIKVIVNPVYLDGNDGLIDLSYYDAMAGCHLGVFPSYYEPWGYTPLESAALAVPAITSDLAGFGRFIQNKIKNKMDDGIFVLERFGKNEEDVIKNFSDLLYEFSQRNHQERTENKLNAKKLSTLASWSVLIEYYIKAHNSALEKIK
ncbi:MAG: hypothetical protein U9O94_09760 [Nanoarchaeota archaeon]|nr:hypothetical protein [Nanoarchaeota archaeon]